MQPRGQNVDNMLKIDLDVANFSLRVPSAQRTGTRIEKRIGNPHSRLRAAQK
jgi:hypothetical protein